jgi:hypothetical protein
MELEEQKKKWEKERSDLQEQIRKLQLACMEEERESEMARRREAAAREQLGECNLARIATITCTHTCRSLHIVQVRLTSNFFPAARLNMQTQGGLIGPAADSSAISIPVTPTHQASNDPMHMVTFLEWHVHLEGFVYSHHHRWIL